MWTRSWGTQQQQAQQQKKAVESRSDCRQNLPVDKGLGALMAKVALGATRVGGGRKASSGGNEGHSCRHFYALQSITQKSLALEFYKPHINSEYPIKRAAGGHMVCLEQHPACHLLPHVNYTVFYNLSMKLV